METVRPMFEGISGAIKPISDGVMKALPQPVQDALRIYLDATHINSGADAAHFKAVNEQVESALEADPSLAQKMGPSDAQAILCGNRHDSLPARAMLIRGNTGLRQA